MAKSARNRIERDLPFELAIELFEGPALAQVDDRQDYGEARIRAIGAVAGTILALCLRRAWRCSTDHQLARRKQEGKDVNTVRRSRSDIDRARLLAELAARRPRNAAEIEAQTAEDGDAWTEEDLATATAVYPSPTAQDVRALRARLGLSQAQFARRFGFTVDTVQQYEQGRRVPSGPASTLLRVIESDPEAVMRALDPRHARRFAKALTPS